MRKTKKFLITISIIAAIIAVLNIIPPKQVENNPFIVEKGSLPMLVAHRGGKFNNPENTLKAYKYALSDNVKADVLETDLWLTKDKELILNHDSSINRTSDAELVLNSKEKHYVSNFTLNELENFNFGAKFEALDGTKPYENLVSVNQVDRKEVIKANDVGVTTFDNFLNTFYTSHPNLLFIVEIKNSGQEGFDACDKLVETLNKYPNYKDQIVVGTFNSEIEEYLKTTYPFIMRGASVNVVIGFVVTQLLGVNLFDNSGITCLQLPTNQYGIDLTWNTYINRAHRRNIAVQYWTINDEEEMRFLVNKGCDAIMTDDVDLLRKVLDSSKKAR